MINAVLPKFLFEDEDIVYLTNKGIQIQSGKQTIGSYQIPCYKFYNLNETEVFEKLHSNSLLEATNNSEATNYATRIAAILFLRIRQVSAIKDKDTKVAAACSLLSSVNSLANINMNYAKRFIPLVRSIV